MQKSCHPAVEEENAEDLLRADSSFGGALVVLPLGAGCPRLSSAQKHAWLEKKYSVVGSNLVGQSCSL